MYITTGKSIFSIDSGKKIISYMGRLPHRKNKIFQKPFHARMTSAGNLLIQDLA